GRGGRGGEANVGRCPCGGQCTGPERPYEGAPRAPCGRGDRRGGLEGSSRPGGPAGATEAVARAALEDVRQDGRPRAEARALQSYGGHATSLCLKTRPA